MTNLFLVGLGGMIGSMARYALGGAVSALVKTDSFPYGTLAVNLIGCFFAGVSGRVWELKGDHSPELRAFVSIGILGGFTTFSAFAYEADALLRAGKNIPASLDLALQLAGGMSCIALGRLVAGALFR